MGANRRHPVLQTMNPTNQYLFGYEYQERCLMCPGAIYRISSTPTNTRYFYTCPLCAPHAFEEVDHPEKYATRYYLRYKEDV